MPHAALLVVQDPMYTNDGVEASLVSMPHAALLVVQGLDLHGRLPERIVSMPHAALLVVQDD